MTTPEPTDEGIVAASGWCAPNEALYRLPEIGIRRGGVGASPYPITPLTPPVPLTRRQRIVKGWRKLRERTRAVRYAVGKAWKFPDGYWDAD